MSKYYIAYGSNLDVRQMKHRTPDAEIMGTATLEGWQLLFKRHATIVPDAERNTPVLVWKISDSDEKNLDRYEGYPYYYYKKELEVKVTPLEGGEPMNLTAMVYIMADDHKKREPDAFYYKVLLDGYLNFKFSLPILEQALADSIGKRKAVSWLKANGMTKQQEVTQDA